MRYDDVLIVIPCLNEEAHLPGLLASIATGAPGARIVVADGGSTDASRRIVADHAAVDPAIVLLHNPARIQSVGINRAVTRFGAGRRWLIRLDAHCGYPPGFVAGLVARARVGDVAAVVVPMRTVGSGCFQRAVAAVQNSVLGTGGSPHRHVGGGSRIVDHGHHALMRIDSFVAAGGYCEQLAHNEDFELDHRLGLGGGTIWLEASLGIDYHPRRSMLALFRQYRGYGAAKAVTSRHHRLPLKLRQLLPVAVVPAVMAAVVSPAGMLVAPPLGWLMMAPMSVWLTVTLAFGLVLGVRDRSRCSVMAGVAGATMHLAWGWGFVARRCRGDKPMLTPGITCAAHDDLHVLLGMSVGAIETTLA